MAHIFSVRELTQAVKATLEGEFPFVWVRGQVSNLSRPGSGHVYFTLKDSETCLSSVWFKSQQWQAASVRTGLADGQEVVCAGRLSVYPPRGAYQLVVEMVQDQGLGFLFLAFEALKKRLAGLGYFDPQRKRPLPGHPLRVSVITAPGGAALRDFVRLASERGFGASIRVHPVLVQGDGAAAQIVQAMEEVNDQGWAEAMVLIRGGGSLEDLWAFNTEEVAHAVFASAIPVLTGIGHETDTSIADLVADLRAATPSHAAQMLWPERSVLAQMIDDLEARLVQTVQEFLRRGREALKTREKALTWLSPRSRVLRALERLEGLEKSLARLGREAVSRREMEMIQACRSLTKSLDERFWQVLMLRLEQVGKNLGAAMAEGVLHRERSLGRSEAALPGLDPARPLERGFCLVQTAAGTYLRDASEVEPGDQVHILPRKGLVVVEVLNKRDEAARV